MSGQSFIAYDLAVIADREFDVKPTTSGFITAVELGHQRKRVRKISTGSKQLDAILGG